MWGQHLVIQQGGKGRGGHKKTTQIPRTWLHAKLQLFHGAELCLCQLIWDGRDMVFWTPGSRGPRSSVIHALHCLLHVISFHCMFAWLVYTRDHRQEYRNPKKKCYLQRFQSLWNKLYVEINIRILLVLSESYTFWRQTHHGTDCQGSQT